METPLPKATEAGKQYRIQLVTGSPTDISVSNSWLLAHLAQGHHGLEDVTFQLWKGLLCTGGQPVYRKALEEGSRGKSTMLL